MRAQITANLKGRKWEAVGTIPGTSKALAPNGDITRTAKGAFAEDAIAAVQDELTLASAADQAAAAVEQAQIDGSVIQQDARNTVETRKNERASAATTITETVDI